ncbi:outer membrane lipocarrier protein LolA family protein [Asticcacaulis biprosthecium C19]|uniref:Outer membrane lipocarrier protein LolA family protein n=1 Tax=Asticcacaulis biprosthecium C19 TaxID=715226 RepID=F4QK09_9CAUL|nr:outer-membrane lipoprotein carrier protein LolA [Asticcacaulis biprosthecium]EGF92036.1 outer membrane lipocarrier protein LolA family protein [Asticcacaulis biprosthecium C19]
MTDLHRRFLLTGLTAAALTAAVPALAQGGKNSFGGLITPPTFNAADKGRIDKATQYLQALTTAQGRFEQTDFRGRKTLGNWYLSRPGKIRFEYDAPYSLLIVADGQKVKMWDPRLKSFDEYPLGETPLSLFLSRQIRLDQNVVVTQVKSSALGFTLSARDRRKQVEGHIALVFDQAGNGNLTLREWTVTDAQGKATRVHLTSFNRGGGFKSDLFVLSKSQMKK